MDNNNLIYQYYYRGKKNRRKFDGDRFSAASRSEALRAAVFFGLTCLCLVLYQGLTHWPHFSLSNIRVIGNQRLSEAELIRASALKPGLNLLSINVPLIQKRLATNPWVAEASVRRLPPGGVEIEVSEHVAVAVIEADGDYLLNTNGDIFKKAGDGEGEGLPRIRGMGVSDLGIDGGGRSKAFKALMNVLRSGIDPKGVLPNRRIAAIEVDRDIGVTIHPAPAPDHLNISEIRLGFGDYSAKYQRLDKIVSYLGEQRPQPDISVMDLSNLDRIVVNPSGYESSLAGWRKED